MNNLTRNFNFQNREIRTLLINDEPYFVGKDVAFVLGYKDTADALKKHIDVDDKMSRQIADSLNRMQNTIVINESGLYSLILSSKLPTAKKFKKWVTSEVLPAIRKTGGYQVPKNPMDALKLMFEAQAQTNERVNSIATDVKELKDDKLLSPGEYNHLGNQIKKRVRTIKEVRNLNLTSKQNCKIYSFINRDLNKYVGIHTRSQFKEKDFDRALDFVANWDLSYTDLKIIDEIENG